MRTARFSEQAAYLGGINPASHSTEQNTGYLSLANYHRAVVIIHCGVIGGNLDVDFEEATDTSASGAQSFNSAGKDIAKTATTDNNTISIIEIDCDELDIADGYDCLNVEVTPASAGIFGVQVWGLEPRYAPVATSNVDSITD